MDLVRRVFKRRMKVFDLVRCKNEKKKISFNSKCVQDIFIFRVIISISHTYIHKNQYIISYVDVSNLNV